MPMVSLKLMAGAARDMVVASARTNDGRRDSRAMVSKEGPGGGPREAIPGGVMGGRRACVLNKRSQASCVSRLPHKFHVFETEHHSAV